MSRGALQRPSTRDRRLLEKRHTLGFCQLREVPISICCPFSLISLILCMFAIVNCVSHIYGVVINMVLVCIQPPYEVQFIDFLPIFRSRVPFPFVQCTSITLHLIELHLFSNYPVLTFLDLHELKHL